MEKRMENCWIKSMSGRCFDETLDFKSNVNTIRCTHEYSKRSLSVKQGEAKLNKFTIVTCVKCEQQANHYDLSL